MISTDSVDELLCRSRIDPSRISSETTEQDCPEESGIDQCADGDDHRRSEELKVKRPESIYSSQLFYLEKGFIRREVYFL